MVCVNAISWTQLGQFLHVSMTHKKSRAFSGELFTARQPHPVPAHVKFACVVLSTQRLNFGIRPSLCSSWAFKQRTTTPSYLFSGKLAAPLDETSALSDPGQVLMTFPPNTFQVRQPAFHPYMEDITPEALQDWRPTLVPPFSCQHMWRSHIQFSDQRPRSFPVYDWVSKAHSKYRCSLCWGICDHHGKICDDMTGIRRQRHDGVLL